MAREEDQEASWRVLARTASSEADPRARAAAVLTLAKTATGIPPSSSREIAAQVALAVKDRGVPVRRAALRLIEWFGRRPAAEAFGEHLPLVSSAVADALTDEDVPVRCWAARALTCLGADAASQVNNVLVALRDNDAAVRCLACGALARMGPDGMGHAAAQAASVAYSLMDDDVEVRRAAAFALAQMDDIAIAFAAKFARTLRRRPSIEGGGLIEPDAEVRRLCVSALERMGEQAACYSEELLSALESDPDPVVRRWAIRALEHAARARHVLRGDDADTKQPSPMKVIALCIADPDPIVRQWVLLTLARFGQEAASVSEVMRAITQALGEQEPLAVRCLAVGTASQFEETKNLARHHFQCVLEALNSSDREIRRIGCLALALSGSLDVPSTSEKVFEALSHDDVVVRRGAARAMEQLPSFKEDAITHVATHLKDSDVAVRLSTLRTLGQLEYQAERYAQEVSDVLRDAEAHPAETLVAFYTLPRMGGTGERLMREHIKAKEAANIKALDQNNVFEECYRGVFDAVSRFGYSVSMTAKEYMPASLKPCFRASSTGRRESYSFR